MPPEIRSHGHRKGGDNENIVIGKEGGVNYYDRSPKKAGAEEPGGGVSMSLTRA